MFGVLKAKPLAQPVDGTTARRLIENGARLIDVRSPREFAAGHIEGAENIPVDVIVASPISLAKSDQPVVLCCRSGARSARAGIALRDAGVEVYDLGSLEAW